MKEEIGQLMKQASELQAKMKQVQSELDSERVEGVSGGGLVKVEMNGRHDVCKVSIDENLMEDREVLEDLVAAAINDAVRRVDEASQAKLEDLTGGINLPMQNWPI